MIEYLLTFTIIIITNICFLQFWYKKFKCIPLKKISGELANEHNEGYKEGVEWGKKEIKHIEEKNRQELLRIHYKHGAELKKFENTIQRLEDVISSFQKDSIQIENEKMILKELTGSFKEYMSDVHDFIRNMAGKSENIFQKANRIDNVNEILFYNSQQEDEN